MPSETRLLSLQKPFLLQQGKQKEERYKQASKEASNKATNIIISDHNQFQRISQKCDIVTLQFDQGGKRKIIHEGKKEKRKKETKNRQ